MDFVDFTEKPALTPDPNDDELEPMPDLEQLIQPEPSSVAEPAETWPQTDEPEPESAENERAFQAVLEHLMHITEQLRLDFENKILYDAGKDRQIDHLHSELQAYRAGFHFKIIRPLIMDLISMHDDLTGLIEDFSSREEAIPAKQASDNLASFRETIEHVLERHGVNVYTEEGDLFISGKQRTLKAIETPEASQDKQIARRVSRGFEYEQKVLRPELVITYRASVR